MISHTWQQSNDSHQVEIVIDPWKAENCKMWVSEECQVLVKSPNRYLPISKVIS